MGIYLTLLLNKCVIFQNRSLYLMVAHTDGVSAIQGGENMRNYFGMYYPSTQLPDDWIKMAALYWDKIGRIEWPGGGWGKDSDVVRQLRDETGFVVDLAPSNDELLFVSNLIITMLNTNHEEIIKHYSISSLIKIYGSGLFPKLNLISQKLLAQDLFVSILNADLGQLVNFLNPASGHVVLQEDGILEFHVNALDQIASQALNVHQGTYFFYMKTLAEQMATARQLHLITDNTFNHVAASGYTLERVAQAMLLSDDMQPHLVTSQEASNDEIELQMATIALQAVLPQDIRNISVKQIIKLRNQHRDEMAVFQEYLHNFATDLVTLEDIQDPKALMAHLELEYEKRLKPQLDDLKKLLKSIGIDAIEGLLNIRVELPPIFLTGADYLAQAHALPSVNPIIAGAGTLALSAFPVIRKRQKDTKQALRSSPAAYLLHIQEGLEPTTATTWITRQARQILYRV